MGRAHRVLVDAPCSGSGLLGRNPDARWTLEEDRIRRLPDLQRTILDRLAPLVARGGRLIYATRSLLRDENDAVVAKFLADHPEFIRIPAKEILGKERASGVGDEICLRLYPHVHGTDGLFATALRRVESATS